MLNRKRFLIIFIVSLVAIAATLYFKPRETWKVIELGRIHQSVINSFIFSPDGKIIATSNDREVTLWNLEAEKLGHYYLIQQKLKSKVSYLVQMGN